MSFAYEIQQTFLDVLVNDEPYFKNFFTRSTVMVPVQPEQLPFLGVYLRQDRAMPDGDANQGMIAFRHTALIGFSVMVACNDSALADQELEIALDKIMTRLYCDPHIMNKITANTPRRVVADSIESGVAIKVMGNAQLNNETPLAELRYELSVGFRDYWYPEITDDFRRMDVYTRLKPGMPVIKSRYLFEPSEPPPATE